MAGTTASAAVAHRWKEQGRVGRAADRDEFEIPVFDADSTVRGSGHHDPSGLAGKPAGRARGVGIAIAAISLLAVALAIGGSLEPSVPSGNPAPALTARPCERVSTTNAPTFGIRAVGSDAAWGGALGSTHVPGADIPGRGWQVPVPEPGRPAHDVGSGVSLELSAVPGTCVRYLFVEFAYASLATPDPADRQGLIRTTIEPPSANPLIGTLPDGDWVVRALAHFETGPDGSEGLVVSEFYFRVRVGSGPDRRPTPAPTPAVTPAVACGPVPASADEVEVVLGAPGIESVAGAPEGADAPVVTIPPGEDPLVSVVGDACASSWDIGAFVDGLEWRAGAHYRNPQNDPRLASQNRWLIRPGEGTFDVVARLHFEPGVDVVRSWRMEAPGLTVPDTFLVAETGARIRALPGCDSTVSLENGYTSNSVPCGEVLEVPDELAVLRVPAWSRVALEIPGWTTASWSGSCGELGTDEAGRRVFNQPDNCFLGSYYVALFETPPAPAQFLARPGEHVVSLTLRGTRGGDQYEATIYALVDGR